MNFPPFWAKGEHDGFAAWHWSHQSFADAKARAEQAARKIAGRILAGDIPRHGYGYPDRPFREPVLRELKNQTGDLVGVVTRNSYGSLVLNTARVMFVDVDVPEPRPPGLFKRLFGKPNVAPPSNPVGEIVVKAEQWARQNPSWGWRIYRTRAGVRLLATHAIFNPEIVTANGAFDLLGADPLYRRLCQTQKCFRARLTPKHWRCGMGRPPTRWPFENEKAEARFNKWQGKYEKACAEWSTCELIRTIGSRDVHPDARLVIDLHDGTTRVGEKWPLA